MVVEHPSSYALIVIITFFLINNYHRLLAPPLHRKECRGDAFLVVNISRIVATRKTPKVSKFLFFNLVHHLLLSGTDNFHPATVKVNTSQSLPNHKPCLAGSIEYRHLIFALPPPQYTGHIIILLQSLPPLSHPYTVLPIDKGRWNRMKISFLSPPHPDIGNALKFCIITGKPYFYFFHFTQLFCNSFWFNRTVLFKKSAFNHSV